MAHFIGSLVNVTIWLQHHFMDYSHLSNSTMHRIQTEGTCTVSLKKGQLKQNKKTANQGHFLKTQSSFFFCFSFFQNQSWNKDKSRNLLGKKECLVNVHKHTKNTSGQVFLVWISQVTAIAHCISFGKYFMPKSTCKRSMKTMVTTETHKAFEYFHVSNNNRLLQPTNLR